MAGNLLSYLKLINAIKLSTPKRHSLVSGIVKRAAHQQAFSKGKVNLLSSVKLQCPASSAVVMMLRGLVLQQVLHNKPFAPPLFLIKCQL